jgi:hypothetical protein
MEKHHHHVQVGFILNSVPQVCGLEVFDGQIAACKSTNEVDSEPSNQAVNHKMLESTLDSDYDIYLNWQLYETNVQKLRC